MQRVQLLGVSLVLAVAGCGGHTSIIANPQPAPTSVTIEVRTAAGSPAAGADVQLASTVGMIASPGDTVELPSVTLVHAPPGNP